MTEQEIERRAMHARELHEKGFNCSQAVFAATADLYGIEQNDALRLAASFGGGIGAMRETCGCCCAMFMFEGLRSGSATEGDRVGKRKNYSNVQQLAAKFADMHGGSIICRELLANPANPSCSDKCANAVRIVLQDD